MKYTPSRTLIRYTAHALSMALLGPWSGAWRELQRPILVPIPSLPRNVKARMVDVPLSLCQNLSRSLNVETRELLHSRDLSLPQKSQRLMKRLQTAKRRLRVDPGTPASSQPLVLVDDVVTSGASIRVASQLLEAAGWQVSAAIALSTVHLHPLALEQMWIS